MNKRLIYGDIGGTKAILQLGELVDGHVHEQFTQRYDSSAYMTFCDLLGEFLHQAGATESSNSPLAACFAVAGPITEQQVQLTNLSWQISSAQIADTFSIPAVQLINDFEAVALAVEMLSPVDLITLQAGKAQAQSMRVVLGAGTGMGVAWLTWQGDRYVPLSTEAGHMDFAPTNALQISLFEALQQKFGHVSVERLLSGPGLTNIFHCLQMNLAAFPGLTQLELAEDSGATITTLALIHKHPIAIKALNLFVEIYGAYAGNLALAGLCRGGVYIAGGIAPKIIQSLSSGSFMQAFRDKGRFSAMMSEIPVHIITNLNVGLLGVKRKAHHLLTAQN